jgi:L-lactate dehydrogenase
MPPRERVAIIGAGHVGATTAYGLMLRALFREIVLIDRDIKLADAEATDLSHANALARPTRIWAGAYADAATARIAILTAGAATHGEQTRLSVASQSAAIVVGCVRQLVEAGFDGVIVVAANPVDLMTLVADRTAGLPAGRVIGTGTLLDTSRLRQLLASRLGVAPASVDGDVLGEHGDSEVAAFSTVRIGGLKLDRFDTAGRARAHAELAEEVRNAGYRIVAGKGYTSFGVATAIVRICEAILRDEKVVLPVSALLTGQYGISDTFLSLPCILGAAGVERILAPALSAEEQAGLVASANTLKAALAGLDAAA